MVTRGWSTKKQSKKIFLKNVNKTNFLKTLSSNWSSTWRLQVAVDCRWRTAKNIEMYQLTGSNLGKVSRLMWKLNYRTCQRIKFNLYMQPNELRSHRLPVRNLFATPTSLFKEKPNYDTSTSKNPILFGEIEKEEPKIKVIYMVIFWQDLIISFEVLITSRCTAYSVSLSLSLVNHKPLDYLRF